MPNNQPINNNNIATQRMVPPGQPNQMVGSKQAVPINQVSNQ